MYIAWMSDVFITLIIPITLYGVYLKQQRFIYNSHYIILLIHRKIFPSQWLKIYRAPTVLTFPGHQARKNYLKGFTQKLNVGIRKETCYIHSTILRQSWPHQIARPRKQSYHLPGRKEPEIRPNDCCTWQPEINVFSWSWKSSYTSTENMYQSHKGNYKERIDVDTKFNLKALSFLCSIWNNILIFSNVHYHLLKISMLLFHSLHVKFFCQ